jgi:hypothetical protein
MAYASAPRLPLGVAVLAVLTGIFGAFVLIAGLVILLVALFALAGYGWTAMFGAGTVVGLITLIIGAVILAVASGLWDQELWALVIAIIVTGLLVVWFIVRPLWYGGGVDSILTLPAIISGVLFVYLLAVQDAFW